MKTAIASHLPDGSTELDALIKEARRRQRRRYLTTCLCVVAVIAGAVAVVSGTGARDRPGPPGRHPGPAAPPAATRPKSPPSQGPILAGSDTTLVTWPVGYPAFGPGFAPSAYVDDLGTGRLSQHQIPGIAGCDCNPYVISTGRWLVYVGAGGVAAIRPDLQGRPRVLGATAFFAPSAAPGHVWLVRFHGYLGQPPIRVQSVQIAAGPPGPVIKLPPGAVNLVEGTSAGLLLETERRLAHGYTFNGVALWNPGSAPVGLPYSPAWGDGFAADARLIAYGTGCRIAVTAGDAGYDACHTLRVLDVVTGRVVSVAAPSGTAGWLPFGFNRVSAISPRDNMIAAYSAVLPRRDSGFPARLLKTRAVPIGSARLYVIRLANAHVRATSVPSAAAQIAHTAWSVMGSWLLYQGPGGHLFAYQPTSGKTRSSSTPCCQAEVMVTAPSHSG